MSGRHSRNKGARAERELFALLSADLGVSIQRNLVQSRAGGCDSEAEDFPYAVEVKNVRQIARPAWWHQACEQAAKANKLPALFYRRPKQRGASQESAWAAVLPVPYAVRGAIVPRAPGHTLQHGDDVSQHTLGVEMSYEAAVEVMREVMRRTAAIEQGLKA